MTPSAHLYAPPVEMFTCKLRFVGTNPQARRHRKLRYNRRRQELRTFNTFLAALLKTLDVITMPDGELTQVCRITWIPIEPDTKREWTRTPALEGKKHRFSWLDCTCKSDVLGRCVVHHDHTPVMNYRECELRIVYVHLSEPGNARELFELFEETLSVLNCAHGPAEVDSGFNFNQGLRTPVIRIDGFRVDDCPRPFVELVHWMIRHQKELRKIAPELVDALAASQIVLHHLT